MAGDDMPQLGMKADSASEEIVYDLHLVSPGYFSVMGIELLAGRDFGPDDHASSQRVVIVSETLVRRYFGPTTEVESVVGRVLAPLLYETAPPLVVGVARSTRHRGPKYPLSPRSTRLCRSSRSNRSRFSCAESRRCSVMSSPKSPRGWLRSSGGRH
jgi:hypothetical protein